MTPPIFFEHYKSVLAKFGHEAALEADTILEKDEKITLYYTPFEMVNTEAKLVLVGITPGRQQVRDAYRLAHQFIQEGRPDHEVLTRVKTAATFSGANMRHNLRKILTTYKIDELIGISDPDSLWGGAAHLLHATSVIPHAAFSGHRNFAGEFSDVRASPVLWNCFIRDFVSSLGSLPPKARFLPLGHTAQNALTWCVEKEYIVAEQVLGSVPHPSGAGGSRVSVFVGERRPDDLGEGDPVRREIHKLQQDARRIQATVAGLLQLNPADAGSPWGMDFTVGPHEFATQTSAKPPKAGTPARSKATPDVADFDHLTSCFERAGYQLSHATKKVAGFMHGRGGRTVYLDRQVKGIGIWVHPAHAEEANAIAADFTKSRLRYTKHSNLTTFPRYEHSGEHYGLKVAFENASDLEHFLNHFC